jgi:hypothetical protein
MLMFKRGFTVVFHTCIYRILIRLTPFLFLSPYPVLFNSLQWVQLYHHLICSVFWYYLLYHSLFFSPLPQSTETVPPLQTYLYTYINTYIYAYIYLYNHVCIYVYVYLFVFSFHIWVKICNLCPSEPGYLT